MSVQDNLLIQGLYKRDLRRGVFIIFKKAREWARALIQRFDIRVSSPDELVSNLSGGNQQKIVVSRNLDETPDLLVAVNPTRGLDVRAAQFVHEQILAARSQGAAIALFSTDLDELSQLADRTVFMSGGRVVAAHGAESLVGGSL